jgi:hypothetical protein
MQTWATQAVAWKVTCRARHLQRSFPSHLAVTNRTGWFVGAEDDATVGHGEVDGAHGRREDAVVEQAATGVEHHRK